MSAFAEVLTADLLVSRNLVNCLPDPRHLVLELGDREHEHGDELPVVREDLGSLLRTFDLLKSGQVFVQYLENTNVLGDKSPCIIISDSSRADVMLEELKIRQMFLDPLPQLGISLLDDETPNLICQVGNLFVKSIPFSPLLLLWLSQVA